jgi:hypothetical protein
VEDLVGVPGAVDRRDGVGTRLGTDGRAAGERYDVLPGGRTVADEALRDEDAVTSPTLGLERQLKGN